MKIPYHVYRVECDDSGVIETFQAAFMTRLKAMEYAEGKAGKGAVYEVIKTPAAFGQYRGPRGTYLLLRNESAQAAP